MNKILKLVKGNLHKDRKQLIMVFVILMLAFYILNFAFIIIGYDKMYDDKAKKQNVQDALIFSVTNKDDIERIISSNEYVEEYSCQDCAVIFLPLYKGESISGKAYDTANSIIYQNADDFGIANPPKYIKKAKKRSEHGIVITLYISKYMNVDLGDKITFGDSIYGTNTFTVDGIVENYFNGTYGTNNNLLLYKDDFERINKIRNSQFRQYGDYGNYLIKLRYKAGVDAIKETDAIKTELKKYSYVGYGDELAYIYNYALVEVKTAYTSLTNIIGAIAIALAVIIVLVTMIIVIFSIRNNINRDITNIGALKAVGFSVGQIRLSIVSLYFILMGIAMGIGTVLCYVTFPIISRSFLEKQTGLVWDSHIHFAEFAVAFVIFEVVIILSTLISTHRIKLLHPAIALRFGLKSHSFKKNPIPLAKTKCNLDFLLACKTFLQSTRQNIILYLIMSVISFTLMVSGVLYYNSKCDAKAFVKLFYSNDVHGYVRFDLGKLYNFDETKSIDEAVEAGDKIIGEIRADIDRQPNVNSCFSISYFNLMAEGYGTSGTYTSDADDIDLNLYKGTTPKLDNEVVIGSILANCLDKDVGDEVTFTCDDKSATYVICGVEQCVFGLGKMSHFTEEGAKRLGITPRYEAISYNTKNPCEDIEEVINYINDNYKEYITENTNQYKDNRSSKNVYLTTVVYVVIFLIILAMIIIAAMISILMKSILFQKEKEFGIKKAIGFTSKQLRWELALSLSLVVLAAAITGSVLGFYFTNTILELSLGSFGILKTSFTVPGLMIILIIGMICTFTLLISYIMSARIKKVTPYDLLQE